MKKLFTILLIFLLISFQSCKMVDSKNSSSTVESNNSISVQSEISSSIQSEMSSSIQSEIAADIGLKLLGTTVNVDLDGDNVIESVFYSLDDFKINGISYKSEIAAVYGNQPMTDYFIIADIDKNDNQIEIGLKINGESDDPEIFFYRYNENLIPMGSIPTNITKYSDAFDGNGNIKGLMRLSILQTWWATGIWEMKSDNTVALKAQDVYIPVKMSGDDYSLKIALPIYKNKGDNAIFTQMNPQKINLTATDNKNWCQITGADNVTGWFRIDGYDTITDLELTAFEVFDGLSNAD